MGGPFRVQLSRRKGWRMPENTVSVARPGKWGNPFKVGDNASQFSIALPSEVTSVEEAIECFRYYADTWQQLRGGQWVEPLRGKNLACWCGLCDAHKGGKPFGVVCSDCSPCHSDVLGELANPADACGGPTHDRSS